MWVSASSASCTAQVKYSQSGIPFAIGVKDERERHELRARKGKYVSYLNLQPYGILFGILLQKYIEPYNWVDKL